MFLRVITLTIFLSLNFINNEDNAIIKELNLSHIYIYIYIYIYVCSLNVEILYLVDGIFIYLEFMKFGIDLAETGCMSFLVTLIIGNVFWIKFCFRFRLEWFVRLGEFVGLFVVRLIWFRIELLSVFMW
jgi:hypothetical protein